MHLSTSSRCIYFHFHFIGYSFNLLVIDLLVPCSPLKSCWLVCFSRACLIWYCLLLLYIMWQSFSFFEDFLEMFWRQHHPIFLCYSESTTVFGIILGTQSLEFLAFNGNLPSTNWIHWENHPLLRYPDFGCLRSGYRYLVLEPEDLPCHQASCRPMKRGFGNSWATNSRFVTGRRSSSYASYAKGFQMVPSCKSPAIFFVSKASIATILLVELKVLRASGFLIIVWRTFPRVSWQQVGVNTDNGTTTHQLLCPRLGLSLRMFKDV